MNPRNADRREPVIRRLELPPNIADNDVPMHDAERSVVYGKRGDHGREAERTPGAVMEYSRPESEPRSEASVEPHVSPWGETSRSASAMGEQPEVELDASTFVLVQPEEQPETHPYVHGSGPR